MLTNKSKAYTFPKLFSIVHIILNCGKNRRSTVGEQDCTEAKRETPHCGIGILHFIVDRRGFDDGLHDHHDHRDDGRDRGDQWAHPAQKCTRSNIVCAHRNVYVLKCL